MSAGESLERRLANLSPGQRALLERRLMERQAETASRNTIPPRTSDGPAPLSHAQELLWLLSQVFDDGIAYNSPGAFQLIGPLDLDLLAKALNGLLERHSILRTTYTVKDGRPVQIIGAGEPLEINFVDLKATPPEQREAESQRVLREESRFRFDLVNGPVVRSTVIRLDDQEHILMLNMHHIATDGYSRAALYRDLTALYEAYGKGLPSPLVPLNIQYADFAEWQRKWLDGGVADAQLEYWKQKLHRAPSQLDLPTDFPRPPVRSWVGANMSVMLDLESREGLRAAARGRDATLFVGLLATFGILLSRYSGQDDVVIGTPFAGRNRTELESMVGYFINPLALRLDLSGDPTFGELMGRARETVLDAFAHADVPYEDVVRATRPQRDLSQTPVFQAMMVLHNPAWQTQRPKFQPEGIRCVEITHEKGWSKFDLLLGMSERTTGLNTTWEYSTELFRPASIERLMDHFRALVESAGAAPERPISKLSMLSESERAHVVRAWNKPTAPLGEAESIKELFEAQVAKTPDAPAVSFQGATISYAELNKRANRIAWMLRERGAGPGDLIGILMEKSLDLLPTVIGVVKSGAAYVPLDPLYPADRIEFMVSDAAPKLLLTQLKHIDVAPLGSEQVVAVDAPGALDGFADTDPPQIHDGDDLAYVIFTSGSTGKPKGAMIAHRSLASAFFAYERAYKLRELHAHAQMASFSFDVFTGDMIRSLLVGAKLVLCPIETIVDAGALHALMLSEGIDMAEFVPATASLMFAWCEREGKTMDHMRLVVVSSEAWRNEQYTSFKRFCGPNTRLVNSYGLTEATIDSTWFEPSDDTELLPGRFVPIGRALDNTKVYVLDANLEPLPIGIPGELCVGGVPVARGYLNRPELSAERFVPDPFEPKRPGALLYRTGDLARWLPDGQIDYLGRADRQVKIRGFRIELGEIEAALEAQVGVRAAAVVDRVDPGGETRLVAYLVATDPEDEPAQDRLRRALEQRLPGYMIPAGWVFLDELPRSSNGKLDISALPDPSYDRSAVDVEFVGATDEIEERLMAIWSEILGVSRIGLDDDFFELGGHSLLAVALFAAIEQEFDIPLPLTVLFRMGTVRNLAAELRRGGKGGDEPVTLALQPQGQRTPLFCIAGVHVYQALANELGPDIPVYGVFLPAEQDLFGTGGVTSGGRVPTIQEIAASYIDAIRVEQPEGPYQLFGFCFGGVVVYEMARQLEAAGETASLVAMLDTVLPGAFVLNPREKARRRYMRLRRNLRRRLRPPRPDEAFEQKARRLWELRDMIYRKSVSGYKPVGRDGATMIIKCQVTLDRPHGEMVDQTFGFGKLAPQLTSMIVPDSHATALHKPGVRDLARALREQIDAVDESVSPAVRG
jgi:amino acid adenylation domain-containing protein